MTYYYTETRPKADTKFRIRYTRRPGVKLTVKDSFDWLLVKNNCCLYGTDEAECLFRDGQDSAEDTANTVRKLSKNRYLFDKFSFKTLEWTFTTPHENNGEITELKTGVHKAYIIRTEKPEDDMALHYCLEEIASFGEGLLRCVRSSGDSMLTYTTRAECPYEKDAVIRDSMSAVHQHLLKLILLNRDGVLKGYDTEFLHDLRVSVRRIRSAMSIVKNVYTKEVEAQYRVLFKEMGELTSRARDMDVYLEEIDEYSDILPEDMREGLLPIRAHFEKVRESEYRKLRRFIRSPKFDELMSGWNRVTGTYSETGRRGFIKTDKAAEKALKKAYDIADTLTAQIHGETTDPQMHSMRIAFKKLRYTIEFFSQVIGVGRTADVLTDLRALQDCLGRYNDFSVQCWNMTGIMVKQTDAKVSAVCGYILSYLSARKDAERQNAEGLIKAFRKRRKHIRSSLRI
ncbi:MAG: CHAD domain-containing protein [Deferribacterales bacterium]